MKPVLYGRNVILRPLSSEDAVNIHAGLTDPEVRRLTGTHARFTLVDVVHHCRHVEIAEDRWDYAITTDGQLIGEAVLSDVDLNNKSASFRIAIWNGASRDQGHGTDATRTLMRFAFDMLALNRVELEVYAFNPRARRVYEKVGFKHEGTRREALIWNGVAIDAYAMGLLRKEFVGNDAAMAC